MVKIYACLLGNWVCLNDDETCKIGENLQAPEQWYEETHDVYAPKNRNRENDFYELDYVRILYKGTSYKINPIFIQLVTT